MLLQTFHHRSIQVYDPVFQKDIQCLARPLTNPAETGRLKTQSAPRRRYTSAASSSFQTFPETNN